MKTIPKEYARYSRLRCIIDCSEVFIQKPSNLLTQAATWSDYKHHNTLKFLVAVTPQGSICYVSELWGGRASDRHIVINSSFLAALHPGDKILADRGFTVREEIMMKGAELIIPPACKGKAQMSSNDVAKTKRVANTRIHVERVIQRLKHFKILSQTIPVTILPLMNEIVFVCCAVTNLKGPIVKSWCHVD